jgi:hypothetical protein
MDTSALRKHIQTLVSGEGAHITFASAIKGFPVELAGRRVPNLPHTAWHLVEHMRIAQWDILEFIKSADHVSPEYPHGYWPETDGPADAGEWKKSINSIKTGLDEMHAMIGDEGNDLFAGIPHGSGQTLLREALVLADHNAYHLAQLIDLRMLLGVPVRDY